MPSLIRTERGWPAHYCCSSRCVFHRNTLLQLGEIAIIVSTVGDLRVRAQLEGETIEEIGDHRYYETAAFGVLQEGPFIDTDITTRVLFDSPWALPNSNDSRMWNADGIPLEADVDANAMHEAVVNELSAKMLAGTVVIKPATGYSESVG